jgi:hypothetical protein
MPGCKPILTVEFAPLIRIVLIEQYTTEEMKFNFFKFSENQLCLIDSNLNDHPKFQNFKKIRLLGAKLSAKIKLELSNAEVSFVCTSHSQE